MDKKLIERIALEVAQEAEVLDADGECPKREGVDITEYVLDFTHRFLARIDAERGKEAACVVNVNGAGKMRISECRTGVLPIGSTKLYLSPAIPEGMALVPIEPTTAMIYAGINTPVTDTGDEIADRPDDYRAVWKSMISAAQGERNAD